MNDVVDEIWKSIWWVAMLKCCSPACWVVWSYVYVQDMCKVSFMSSCTWSGTHCCKGNTSGLHGCCYWSSNRHHEHEADLLSGFGEKPVHLPVDDNGTVENCWSLCLTVRRFMSGCSTVYAERHPKGRIPWSILVVRHSICITSWCEKGSFLEEEATASFVASAVFKLMHIGRMVGIDHKQIDHELGLKQVVMFPPSWEP